MLQVIPISISYSSKYIHIYIYMSFAGGRPMCIEQLAKVAINWNIDRFPEITQTLSILLALMILVSIL